MKFIVSGGSGFIGSNFIHYILKKYDDAEVVNLDKLTYAGNPSTLKDIEKDNRYHFIKGDVCDKKMVAEAMGGCDYVVHFAAESHNTRSENDPNIFYTTNVEGTKNMLECAEKEGVKKVIHISTDEVYGPIVEGYFKENDKKPGDSQATSAYSKSKAQADDVAQSFFGKLPVIIVRPTNNFGPYQYPEKALPRWVTSVVEGQPIIVWGEGLQVRDWLHTEDTARAIDMLLQKGEPGQVYNIGANHKPEMPNIEIAKKIIKILNLPDSMIKKIEDPRPGHDFRYGVDTTKLQKIGWMPGDFNKQFQNTVEWYRDNKWWWQPLKEEAESLYKDKEKK